MASSPTSTTLKKDKKDESLLDKIGTIGRKKKVKEGWNFQSDTFEPLVATRSFPFGIIVTFERIRKVNKDGGDAVM